MLKEKLQILNKLECGVKAVDVCKAYNLSQSTLSAWKKQKAKLKDMVDAGKVLDTKQNHESFLPNIERALHIWFGEMRSKPHVPPLSKQVLVTCSTYYKIYLNTYVNNEFDMFDLLSFSYFTALQSSLVMMTGKVMGHLYTSGLRGMALSTRQFGVQKSW